MVAANVSPEVPEDIDPAVTEPEADEGQLSPEATRWPRFTAITYDGETVDSDDDLSRLLTRLVDAADPRRGPRGPGTIEELTVWAKGETVAAVLRADGKVVRLDGPTLIVETPQLAQGKRSRGGRLPEASARPIVQQRTKERLSRHDTEQEEEKLAGVPPAEVKSAGVVDSDENHAGLLMETRTNVQF